MLIHVMDFRHVSLPVVLSWESLASSTGVVASLNGTMKLLFLFMPVIDMTLQMCLGTKALATCRVRAFVIFAVISLVVPKMC